MTPERWNSIKEVFQAALERDETVRAAFLDGACGSDTDLRREVDRLLREHGESTKLNSPVAKADLSGRTLSHYKILDKIGEGGMGVVYKAQDSRLDRTVALKFLATHVLESEEHKTRFMQEAKAAAAIDHPNICTIHEIDEADGQIFLVMAHVDGETLSAKVRKRPLPLDEALTIAVQAAEGLLAAHKKGIVHRDIKSANIMTDADGRVKVMDFGLAHLAGGTKITETGTVVGTPAYMSPEQVRGEKTDHRTDIWSLGVVIYEMVTGRLPFSGESAQSVALAIQNEKPEPVTALRAGVPMELERIVGKTLAKPAGERYQHVEDLLVDLLSLTKPMEAVASPSAPSRWRTVILLAAAVVVAAVIGREVLSRIRPPDAERAAPQMVPFTTHPGAEYSPVFSPDGNRIAFVAEIEEEGNYDIYVREVDGAGQVRLTTDPAVDLGPVWSPDGSRIVFARLQQAVSIADQRRQFGDFHYFVIPAIGGPERKLTETSHRSLGIVTSQFFGRYWSPDGRFLVLATRHPSKDSGELFLYSMDTGDRRAIWPSESLKVGFTNMSFSPDGRGLAFVEWDGMASDIYLFSLGDDGLPEGEPRRLTFDKAATFGLDWTPNGRHIVFSSTRRGIDSLWRISIDRGEPTALAVAGGPASGPSVSRQGNRLAFLRTVRTSDIWRADLEKGGAPTKLISSTWMEVTPRYSPDGTKIAFTSSRSGNHEIWVCDSDGSNAVPLTDQNSSLTGDASWSPDGRWIAFDSTKEGAHDIYVVGAGGGVPRRLTTDPATDSHPAWSRDGKWIYFSSDRGDVHRLWKTRFEGGPLVEVARSDAGYLEATESPDGKFVYYAVKNEPGIWQVPVEGGEPNRVLDQGSPYGWAMVEDGIYVRSPGPAVEFFDFATGRRKRVVELDGRIGDMGVSPDGRWLLYVKQEVRSNDIMLVENFR